MASQLTRAHIEAERRLRVAAVRTAEHVWRSLPAYNRENLPEWLAQIVPVIGAAQRQSVALTTAYLARSLEIQPPPVPVDQVLRNTRGGVTLDEVYSRPFVTVWTALKNGSPWEQAQASGMARASASAAMDVQLAMRGTMASAESMDNPIIGYERVADGGACPYCQELDGAFVKSADAAAMHPGCGCGLEAITAETRGVRHAQKSNDSVAIREHGELGAVLGDPSHSFTSLL